jgi:peptidoglycan/xylan/chitin deacetylase (PgdA/CDA1 family)
MILAQTTRMLLITFILSGGIVAAATGNYLLGILMHTIIVGFLLTGTLNPSSRLFGQVQTRCGKGIWLTLDDGPDPTDTPAILDLLDRHVAKATFFVIGEKAAKHPELIREIHRRGHQLGNHSWSHPHLSFWRLGPVATYWEIVKCQRVIKEITGEAPKIFRAPVGHYNIFVHPVLKQEGLRLIGWNSRGFDAGGYPLAEVTRRIRDTARDGSIVLAHEATPIALEVVKTILALAEENGWEVAIPDVWPE